MEDKESSTFKVLARESILENEGHSVCLEKLILCEKWLGRHGI